MKLTLEQIELQQAKKIPAWAKENLHHWLKPDSADSNFAYHYYQAHRNLCDSAFYKVWLEQDDIPGGAMPVHYPLERWEIKRWLDEVTWFRAWQIRGPNPPSPSPHQSPPEYPHLG